MVVLLLAAAPAGIGPPYLAPPKASTKASPKPAGTSFRLLASPFGTIHAATFRFSPPLGTDVPADLQLPAYPADGDAALSSGDGEEDWRREFPKIDRSRKGPRLTLRDRPASASAVSGGAAADGPGATSAREAQTGAAAVHPNNPRISEADTQRDSPDRTTAPETASRDAVAPPDGDGPAVRIARIYFATAPSGAIPAMVEAMVAPWPEEATRPDSRPAPPRQDTSSPTPDANPRQPVNQTIAPKGEVTGAGHRPKSPAELLDLTGAARARQEKCLVTAIYFEARGEPVRGQMAVAQVVINRVFSGHYPNNICGVVYQSTRRHRRLRCQFSFTCDHIPDRVTEPEAWEHATRIARDALDGRFWLDDIGKATHYHARWVYPRWVHEMRRLDRIGVHTFYRPRKWGDGAGSPVWGDAGAKLEKL